MAPERIDDRPEDQKSAEERSLDEHLDANRPVRAADDDRPKYISDIERRKRATEPEKYAVSEANPATGGVYPPSAVVEPFSADVIAAHTPGEQARLEAENRRAPAPDDPQAIAEAKGKTGPETTPATSDTSK